MTSAEKPFGNVGKRTIEHDAHHLPVAGDRVLAGRRFGHAADGGGRRRPAPCAPPIAATRPSPSERSVGSRSGTRRAMLPSVSLPSIAVPCGIGQFADADAVHDDDDGAGEGRGHAGYECEK